MAAPSQQAARPRPTRARRSLRGGGNAVDAIVAAALASCVADPCNTGLGGYGGYMLVQPRSGPALCVQFPVCPPSTMSTQALQRAYPDEGPGCSTVPNVVAGLARALATFGTLSWAEVSAPAFRLAAEGIAANSTTRRAFSLHRSRAFMDECFAFTEARDGGLVFRQPQLARTLERIAENGPEWFYSGPLGAAAQPPGSGPASTCPCEDWLDAQQTVEVVEAPALLVEGVRIKAAPLGLSGSACMFAVATAAARLARRELAVDAGGPRRNSPGRSAGIWQHRFAMPSGNDFSGIDLQRVGRGSPRAVARPRARQSPRWATQPISTPSIAKGSSRR